MPDNENVLFSAEWDNSKFIAGVTENVNGLKTMSAEQKVLQTNLDKTTIKAEELQLEIKGLTGTTAEASETQEAYNLRTKQARDEYAKLIETQKFYGVQAEKTTVATKQLDAATQKLAADTRTASKEIPVATAALTKMQATATATGASVGKSLTGAFSQIRQLAFILPGIGIAGLFNLAFEGLSKLVEELNLFSGTLTDTEKHQQALNDALAGSENEYTKAVTLVESLKNEVQLAKEGFLNKEEVLKHYNDTLGKTTGAVTSLDEAEQQLVANGDAYIKMMLFKAAANIALQNAAKLAFDAETRRREDEQKFAELAKGDQVTVGSEVEAETQRRALQKNLQQQALRRQAAEKDSKDLLQIAKDFETQAAQIAKDSGFDFFGGGKGTPKPTPFKKTSTDAAAREAEAEAKRQLKALQDFENTRIQINIDALKRIADDESNSDQIRIFAKQKVAQGEIFLLNKRVNDEIELNKLTGNEILAVRERVKQQTINIENELADFIAAIVKKESEARIKAENDVLAAKEKSIKAQQKLFQDAFDAARKAEQDEATAEEIARNKQIDANLKKIESYKNLFNTILDFYASINEAEQNSVNRSIALQQQRVDNARSIAERGNAEYLALEQKRLDELNRKREIAAQKEIAIANAETIAQALLALITSITQGIKQGNPLFSVTNVAATIALIAAGYKFVSSLQPVSTQFYEGTEYVQQGRHRSGRDTIPARVNIGEAIIPSDTNKAYGDTVRAIYRKTVPAHILNEFVARYPNERIPQTDYVRLGNATDYRTGEANETNKKLDRVYDVLNSIDSSLLGAEPVKVGLDADGFTVAWIKNVRKERLKRKM